MERILGLDYGEKRTGIAVTDPLQIVVNGLETIETNKLLDFLTNYLRTEKVEKIVIGIAIHADGSPVKIEKSIQKLIEKLKNAFPQLLFDRQDETFTSFEAKQILVESGMPKMKRRKKGALDKVSAILILQRYLGHI